MTLEKLRITPQSPSMLRPIEALFNPTTYAISKSVSWTPPRDANGRAIKTQNYLNAPTLSFSGGGTRQLSIDLFFDVTGTIDNGRSRDVRQETNQVVALTRIERVKPTPRPPTCEVSWGNAPPGSDFPFVGVVSSLTQRFTLFQRDGTPLRAELSLVFLEVLDPEADQRQTDPEMTTRIVQLGDTIGGIAAEMYRDPTNWRRIAEANDLDNPRELTIGTSLTIPSLR